MNKKFVISSTILAVIAAILYLWQPANHALFHFVNTALPNKTLWMPITNLGEGLFVGSLIFIVLRNDKRMLTNSLLAGLAMHYSIKYLKLLFAEPRPEHTQGLPDLFTLGPVLNAQDYGMPSGHTATAFMAAIILVRGCSLKGIRLGLVLFAASLVGISRVAVGAHWPCDVFAGAAFGLWIGCLFSHELLNLRSKIFYPLTLALCLPILVYSILRITHVDSVSTALSESVIVMAGFWGLMVWIQKLHAEIKLMKP